jgi:hypothetical protein
LPLVPSFGVGAYVKGAWGVNFLDSQVALSRGDGLVGFSNTRSREGFASVYEVGIMADWQIIRNFHFRGGYTALWLIDVAEAESQVSFNLADTTGRAVNNGHVFFQGPTLQLVFNF